MDAGAFSKFIYQMFGCEALAESLICKLTRSPYNTYNCLTGSQLNWRSKGVTWSNFLEFVTILLGF